MPNPADVVLDAWSALSHKAAVGDPGGFGASPAPTWVGHHRRRLNVYLLLWAYRKNVARYWLRTAPEDPDRYLQHREYGDAELLVQTIRAAVLGGLPRPLVDGSDRELPKPPTKDTVEDDRLAGDQTSALTEATAEWEADRVEIEAATARQEWFDEWWDLELADQKVIETEANSVGLGDGVYELVMSTDKERPRLRIHDPGFYFPVHEDGAQGDDFPDRVHLAWEFIDVDGTMSDPGTKFVRRVTYERVLLGTMTVVDPETGEMSLSNETTRTYPYADKPSRFTVLKTDATWKLADFKDRKVETLLLADAWSIAFNTEGQQILEMDLQQDYIPVVHVPNTPAITELWGESALLRVAQILDDLAANDTDLAVAAALVATPVLVMSGAAPAGSGKTIDTYGPGMVFRTGDGSLNVLDTSKALDALLKFQATLLERLSVVRQVPQSILGRVDLSGNLAGITLLLSFGPFRQYIEDLRLVRRQKHGVLLKFVQRMAISGGWLDAPVLDTNLAFGPFIPTDIGAVKDLVVALKAAGLVSTATAMRILQEAGVDIDSIEEELDAVHHEDFAGAVELANALGQEQPAADYLGITIEPPTPPAPPPASGTPPAPGAPAGQPPSNAGQPPQLP